MSVEIDRNAGRYIWGLLFDGIDEFPASEIRRVLVQVMTDDVVDAWLAALEGEPPEAPSYESNDVVAEFSNEARRERGMYQTPRAVADGMASGLDSSPGARVIDPAAGTGRLLAAVARREPDVKLVGVERERPLAIVAAANLYDLVGPQAVDVFVADGLADDRRWSGGGTYDGVVINPPYIREKGRADEFRRLRDRHDHLAEWFGPRIDVAYLFIHRALDLLAPGGRLVALTSEYWLQATGANQLRRDLAERGHPLTFVRFDEPLFEQAPGQHSLLSVFERERERSVRRSVSSRDVDTECVEWSSLFDDLGDERSIADEDVVLPPAEAFSEEGWSPFSGQRIHDWAERLGKRGTRLDALFEDRQGFVSGADRVTARRLSQLDHPVEDLEPGDPAFVWRNDELTERMQRLRGTVLRPMLRGSAIEPNTVRIEPPDDQFALYIDGDIPEPYREWVVRHLAPLRPALEQRREVREGRMPWYRLHWPRDRSEQTGPKLVVPRRAAEPRFMLDLSGSVVSSDCTYLFPSGEVRDPLAYLVRSMLALNRSAVDRYLRHFGKRKGDALEFYSDPLQSLPLPLQRRRGRLEWQTELLDERHIESLERRVERLCDAVRTGEPGGSGLVRDAPV